MYKGLLKEEVMPDSGVRATIRQELRKYDNPERGKNNLYQNPNYMNELILKYSMNEKEMREFATSRKKRNNM